MNLINNKVLVFDTEYDTSPKRLLALAFKVYENGKKIKEKAQTTFKVLDKNSNSSLVEMKPITGRKHQLRKQLFNIGHSIYGDKKYRSSTSDKGINKDLMLHSYQIRFMIKDKRYTYRALIPDYFKKLLKTKRLNFVDLK